MLQKENPEKFQELMVQEGIRLGILPQVCDINQAYEKLLKLDEFWDLADNVEAAHMGGLVDAVTDRDR